MTPDLAWAIPPDVECVLGQWRGAARSHAGRPCLPKLPQRAWPEGFCQHRYQSYSLPVSLSLSLFNSHFFFLSLSLSHCFFLPVSHFASFSVAPFSSFCFCFSLTFSFFLSQISSFRLRRPDLSFSVTYCTRLQLPPSLTYTHFDLPTVTFFSFFHSLIGFTPAFLQSLHTLLV